MENQELNEKLAKWAGFTLGYMKGWGDYYCYPNSDEKYCGCRDFADSLDACFKWLVPKLDYIAYGGEILFEEQFHPTLKWCCSIPDDPKVGQNRYIGVGEVPALALCKAIEQLIDATTESKRGDK